MKDLFNRSTVGKDVVAGLVLGIESVPDGLAQGLLAMVNPVYGLHAYMVGVASGALFTSSVFMAVQATGAMSLIVASVPQVRGGDNADTSLFLLAMITGVVMLLCGWFKLGSLLRFVPNAVMTGFISAVAILIVLGQLSDLTGYDTEGGNKVAQSMDLLRNLDQVMMPTLAVGVATIVLIIVLEKTRLGALGMVAAIVVASFAVQLLGWTDIAIVNDIAEVPSSLPRPVIPPLALIPPLIIPALSLAFVGLVQGAGVTKNYVNPDGTYPDASGDFVGEGAANVITGLFQGMPVGGSVSATSLVTSAGATTRFANIFAGITIAVAILLFGRTVGLIALPCIAGLLILVGFRTLKPGDIEMVWKTGRVQQAVMLITFVSCLFVPLQYAVLIGVALATLLFVFQQSNKIEVKEWAWQPGEAPVERDAPATVPSNEITLLVPFGSVFFATASLIEEKLPVVTDDTRNAVVILILRGKEDLGSTFLEVLERYAQDLQEHESQLKLVGVAPQVESQMADIRTADIIGRDNIYYGTEKIGEAGTKAWEDAHAWINRNPEQSDETPQSLPPGQ